MSWGFYIGQLTYFVGVAASGVMVVLPYYLHDYKAFGRITILGEFLAVSSIIMCGLFVMVDLGNLPRMLNIILYPNPTSILFWDMIVLNIYLLLNLVIGWNVLSAEKKGMPYPTWVKLLIYLSIPWAFSIHTVTAFLYAGLPGQALLVDGHHGGPFSLLRILLRTGPPHPALPHRAEGVAGSTREKSRSAPWAASSTYAMILNVFFFLLETLHRLLQPDPGSHAPHRVSFCGTRRARDAWCPGCGLRPSSPLSPWCCSSFLPSGRNEHTLAVACVCVVIATWIDKGFGLVIGGFIPNPFERVFEYWPTTPEMVISMGVWATGFFVLTVLYKITVSVKEEIAA